MVDPQQIVIARYSYDPYGNNLSKSGPLADANTYRFSSQEYHQPSGLSLYLYRAYDPNLQRWLNRDPIGELGGLNVYRFVRNNSVNYTDATGEAPGTATTYQNLPPAIVFGGGAPATYGYPITPNGAGVQLLSIAGEATAASLLTLAPEPASKVGAAILWADAYDKAIALGSGDKTYYQKAAEALGGEQWGGTASAIKDWGLFPLQVGAPLKYCRAAGPRTEPGNLAEQLALQEAEAGAGERIMRGEINDPLFPEDVWGKMQHTHESPFGMSITDKGIVPWSSRDTISIHYWLNLETGAKIGFKFKNP
jgi:RHS repeat-associated protein